MIKAEEKIQLSRASELPFHFDVKAPKGLSPRPYQIAGAYYSTLQNNTLFGDDPGLGKTIQSILGMNVRGVKRALILCPSSLARNWEKEIRIWSSTMKVVETFHPKSFLSLGDAIIVPYGQLSRSNDKWKVWEILKSGPFDCVVIDEAHKLKNAKTHRTKLILAKNGLRSAAPICHILTGTPFEKNPMELYGIIRAFCPEVLPSDMDRFGYGVRYCGGHKLVFGDKSYWKFDGASNKEELGRRLRTFFMVRRTKAQVLKDLPPKTVNIIEIEPNSKGRAVLSQLASLEEFHIKRGAGKNAAFEEYSEAWAELGMLKVPYALDYVNTLLEGGWHKVLVFAHHVPVAEALAKGFEELGYKVLLATGKMSTDKRSKLVDKFQAQGDVHRVFVLTQDSMGEGHTLTAASYGVAVEFSTKPGKNIQMEDRGHRIGQNDNFFFDYLVMKGSLDYARLKHGRKRAKDFEEVME